MRISYFEKERLKHHIFCFYGNTEDYFMNGVPCPLLCTEALHSDLKAQGYRRIVFYRHQRGAYFLDQASMDLWHGEKKDSAPQMDDSMFLPGLPRLKGSLLRRQRPAPKSNSLSFPGISPPDMLRTARQFMLDPIETAVIFPDGADVLEEFFNIDKGMSLNDFFISLAERPVSLLSNRNVVIFLLDRTHAQLEELLGQGDWVGIRRSFHLRTTHHSITAPGKAEIRDALHYLRLCGIDGKRLQVRLDELDAVSGMIAAKLAKNIAARENGSVQVYATDEFTDTDLRGVIKYFHNHFSEREVRLDIEACRACCRENDSLPAMERLNRLIGMDRAKKKIQDYITLSKYRVRPAEAPSSRLSMRKPPAKESDVNLHFLFAGKPGTGKTTIARLIGELLCEHGFLTSGHLIDTKVSDLKGEYIGWSEARTREALENAMGGVLFIDEAYELSNEDVFSQAILTQLVKAMEDHRGEFSLIMAGYGENMEVLLHKNPGLKSRFGTNIIEIEDYNGRELAEIFHAMAEEKQLAVSEDLDALLPIFFENWRHAESLDIWGNAREVRNLLDAMLPRCAETGVLTRSIIPEEFQRHTTHEEEEAAVADLSAMVGLESVREEVRRLKFLIQDGADVRPHFLFYGNPGTGKTTVAKMIGHILKEAGVLKSGRVVSVRARDLIAPYRGQTGGKAEAVFKSALNGVLFIDEAYQLTPSRDEPNDLGGAVIDLLLEYTDPREKKPLCIICAGYEEQMRELLNANEGLESRFSHPIRFPNYSAEELLQILKLQLSQTKYRADEDFYLAALKNFRDNIADIGRTHNGRYIGTYLERARAEYLVRTNGQEVKDFVLTAADAPDLTPRSLKSI